MIIIRKKYFSMVYLIRSKTINAKFKYFRDDQIGFANNIEEQEIEKLVFSIHYKINLLIYLDIDKYIY
jgi:hypothetical protein